MKKRPAKIALLASRLQKWPDQVAAGFGYRLHPGIDQAGHLKLFCGKAHGKSAPNNHRQPPESLQRRARSYAEFTGCLIPRQVSPEQQRLPLSLQRLTERLRGLPRLFVADMGVAYHSANVLVAEQLLDFPQILPNLIE
jgi:hypothetical protein